jgi:hypothetical protein
MEIPIMSHFAELDSNNIVLRVLCLENSVMENDQGQRVEQLGIDFLQNLYGANTIWAQTSYNANFRGCYASIGYTFDADLGEYGEFVPPYVEPIEPIDEP